MSPYQIFQDWSELAEWINCPAPLPEDPETPLLTKMLFSAPYEVPENKAKMKAKGTRGGLPRKGTSDVTSKDAEAHSSAKDDVEEEEEEEIHSLPCRGRKKRTASKHLEAEASKKGKASLPDSSNTATNSRSKWRPRDKPLAKS